MAGPAGNRVFSMSRPTRSLRRAQRQRARGISDRCSFRGPHRPVRRVLTREQQCGECDRSGACLSIRVSRVGWAVYPWMQLGLPRHWIRARERMKARGAVHSGYYGQAVHAADAQRNPPARPINVALEQSGPANSGTGDSGLRRCRLLIGSRPTAWSHASGTARSAATRCSQAQHVAR